MDSIAQGYKGVDLGSCSNGLCCWARGQEDGAIVCRQKWKDFKSTLTRQFIIPFTNDKDKLKEPPQLYQLIEKSEWYAFVASRLSPEFVAVHTEQSQRREKCEYNHRLSRKGYVGLEDQLKETMPNEEIDCSLLWRKAREDKQGNIPDPKVVKKAKLIK
ncbi:unnamed protein product [Prunus armeniaca]